jgi:hypothetical protein
VVLVKARHMDGCKRHSYATHDRSDVASCLLLVKNIDALSLMLKSAS